MLRTSKSFNYNCHIFQSCCGTRSARRYLFQCRTCLSKVWYPTVNRFLIRNSLPSTKPKADEKRKLCCYRWPAIFYIFLNNKGSMFSQPRHGVHENGTYTVVRRWDSHHCTRSPPEAMTLPNWGVLSAAPCSLGFVKSWCHCDKKFFFVIEIIKNYDCSQIKKSWKSCA